MRYALLVLLFLAACDKAQTAQCDLGCRNYFRLHYWREAEAEIKQLPEAERPAYRKKKEAELEERMQQNIDLCVTKCKSGASKQRVKCWIDAKTAEEAEKCTD